MTAEIITFPVAKRPPAESPLRREDVRDTIAKALNWDKLGLTLEDVPADTSPHIRRIIEIILGAVRERDSDGDPAA